jgi:hypothetical protein
MTIFDLNQHVVRKYERFARSFTNIQAPDLKAKIDAAYASNRFWPEPMIQIIDAMAITASSAGKLERNLPIGASLFEIYPFTVVSPHCSDRQPDVLHAVLGHGISCPFSPRLGASGRWWFSSWCGRPDSNRHSTFAPRDFLTRATAFAALASRA